MRCKLVQYNLIVSTFLQTPNDVYFDYITLLALQTFMHFDQELCMFTMEYAMTSTQKYTSLFPLIQKGVEKIDI